MTKKAFISILLLLTYSLGFGHNFIPHNHGTEKVEHVAAHENNGHHHHYHNNVTHLNVTHKHISHRDHFDHGFYDLLVCFMHEAHQEESCKENHYVPSKSTRFIVSKLQTVKPIDLLISINLETTNSGLFSGVIVNSTLDYLTPNIESRSLRGPPSIS
jgi:hypothetical protein